MKLQLRSLLISGSALVFAGSIALAANNYRQSTSGGTVTTFKSTDNSGVHTPHVNVDSGTVTSAPANGSTTNTAVTVTNVSGTFLAAATATKFLLCKNESTTASIALNFAGGTAALNTAGNFTLPPGASIVFDGNQVPPGAITGISSAASSPATCLSS